MDGREQLSPQKYISKLHSLYLLLAIGRSNVLVMQPIFGHSNFARIPSPRNPSPPRHTARAARCAGMIGQTRHHRSLYGLIRKLLGLRAFRPTQAPQARWTMCVVKRQDPTNKQTTTDVRAPEVESLAARRFAARSSQLPHSLDNLAQRTTRRRDSDKRNN